MLRLSWYPLSPNMLRIFLASAKQESRFDVPYLVVIISGKASSRVMRLSYRASSRLFFSRNSVKGICFLWKSRYSLVASWQA